MFLVILILPYKKMYFFKYRPNAFINYLRVGYGYNG